MYKQEVGDQLMWKKDKESQYYTKVRGGREKDKIIIYMIYCTHCNKLFYYNLKTVEIEEEIKEGS
jgi:hypothetical protein